MEKIVKYKAWDGEMFDTAEECLAHESDAGLYMFNPDGQRVCDPNNAMIVYVAPGAKHAHMTYYKMCERALSSCHGIAEDEDEARERDELMDDMLYLWDEWEDRYRVVDDTIKRLVMVATEARKEIINKK